METIWVAEETGGGYMVVRTMLDDEVAARWVASMTEEPIFFFAELTTDPVDPGTEAVLRGEIRRNQSALETFDNVVEARDKAQATLAQVRDLLVDRDVSGMGERLFFHRLQKIMS